MSYSYLVFQEPTIAGAGGVGDGAAGSGSAPDYSALIQYMQHYQDQMKK